MVSKNINIFWSCCLINTVSKTTAENRSWIEKKRERSKSNNPSKNIMMTKGDEDINLYFFTRYLINTLNITFAPYTFFKFWSYFLKVNWHQYTRFFLIFILPFFIKYDIMGIVESIHTSNARKFLKLNLIIK